MPTARKENAKAAGRNTITVIIATSASLYTLIDNAMANHANAVTQRTVSERVKIPAKAQNDSTINGADRKNTTATAVATCPAVNTETTMSTNSHGALGALTPVPAVYAHDVVAARTSWAKPASVGSNVCEYIDAPESTLRNTFQYRKTIQANAISAEVRANPHLRISLLRRCALARGLRITVPRWSRKARLRSFHCLIC